MADRRRRRRRASQDSEEDDDSCSGSDSPRSGSPSTKTREGPPRQPREPTPSEVTAARPEPKKEQAESECESEDGGVGEAVLSDYDSADPEENGSHSEGVEEEEEAEHFSDEESKAAAAAASGETKTSEAPSTETTDETEANAVATDASEAVDGQTEALVEEEELVQEAGETGDEGGEEEGEGEGDEREEEEEEAAEGEEEEQRRKDENKTDEKENIAGERQSGDGQESTDDPETKAAVTPGQKLDDDEDRKNPAYIPRKGLFFEHDVRGQTQEEERPKGRNRKLWKDEGRWEHDRFREEEQAPKSRDELVAIYGYDIRNGGGQGERGYRQTRRPRQSTSPVRDKRWGDRGGERERPVRSWQNRERERAAPPLPAPVSPHSHSELDKRGTNPPPRPAPNRNSNNSRPSNPNPNYNQTYTHSQYRNNSNNESNAAPPMHHRERPKAQSDPIGERGGPRRSGGGHGVVIEDISISHGGNRDQEHNVGTMNVSSHNASPRRYQQEQRERNTDRSEPAPVAVSSHREASPPTERPTERKSYSAARRTRSRPSDLGSKQASVDEALAVASVANVSASQTSSQGSVGGKVWATGDGPGNNSSLNDLDQDVARLSLAGQNWSQSPTSYIRSEMRGLPAPMHLPSAPPPFSGMDEMGVGSNRAKRYSSQRQRPVPEPAPPIHMGVMEGHGHYYEPMSYPGPIYGHGEGPAPIPPQGMMVQPEMHIPHPGLHPHQSGGPIANPALYGGPPVSLSPGQPPQQLLPPPFYPPPGVMTFPYPTMYPTPQVHAPAQAQVTYGGVTYYDTMQQQAQPKPSPPRRTSQPVSVKPPPELHFASE